MNASYSTLGLLCLGLLSARAETWPDLTLQQAHEAALRNHPRISVAELTALASRQVAREVRAGFFPQISANVVAVGTAGDNTRLAAIGALNNPSIFDRNAEGLVINQLITDFGRTANLSRSAKLHARAAEDNTQATREQILLAVDSAFYSVLQAQAVTRVAQQTVTNRQVLLEQVSALASNKLRSDLDVSFAKVNLEEAQLLSSRANSDLQASLAQLANVMGLREPRKLPPGRRTPAYRALHQYHRFSPTSPAGPTRPAQRQERARGGAEVRPRRAGPALSHHRRRGQRGRRAHSRSAIARQLRCRRPDLEPAALWRRSLCRAPTTGRVARPSCR